MIEFTTPSGSKIAIELDKGQVTVTWQRYKDGQQYGGPLVFGGGTVVEHPQAGTCLKMGDNNFAPIPAAQIAEVRDFLAAAKQRMASGRARMAAIDAERARVARAIKTSKV